MGRTKAYSSSCSQIILVYLHPSWRNSLFCSQNWQQQKSLKSSFWGLKVIRGHWCWYS